MADRLTQLQDCLDQLVVQMHSCIMYVNTHAPFSHIEGQPDMDPLMDKKPETQTSTQTQGNTQTQTTQDNEQPTEISDENPAGPHTPAVFNASLQELASDLVIRQQQIEYIISVLPGIGTSEKEQESRIRELEEHLRAVETERLQAADERDRLQADLDNMIMRVRRY